MDLMPASHNLARTFGVSASQVQLQKASFFATEDDFDDMGVKRQGQGLWHGNKTFLSLSYYGIILCSLCL